ncbi:MAG: T9SS type A sorting domain-containing protein [Bacteroidales bacterium]|nr:T9SS type A sorting domain-containing protein [Bacteroidales bacterium]
MKKITFLFSFACLVTNFTNSAILSVKSGEDVATVLNTAADGDIIELTETGIYKWDAQVNINTPKSYTIRAKAGLSSRPVIQAGTAVNFGFIFNNQNTASGTQTFDGIAIDGMKCATTFFVLKCAVGQNVDVVMNNCLVRGLANATTPSNIVCFTYSNSAPNPNPNNLTITNSIFMYNGQGVLAASGAGRPKNVTLTNCLFKGKFVRTISNASTYLVDLYSIDHCTFYGNDSTDVILWGNVELKNSIFSNSKKTGSGAWANTFGTGGDLKTKCGVYYTGTPCAYDEALMDASTLRSDPKLNEFGFATAEEYITPGGTDNNPIGFYESNSMTVEDLTTSVKPVTSNTQIEIFQNNNFFRVNGVDNADYTIYNVSGNRIVNGKIVNGEMILNSLARGLYFLKTNGQVAKFVIK